MQPNKQQRASTAATPSEANRPARTKLMVAMAIDRGMLQKIRSTSERSLNPWRLVSQAARYPGQKVTGRKAGIAASVVMICCTVMLEISPSHALEQNALIYNGQPNGRNLFGGSKTDIGLKRHKFMPVP